MRNWEMLRRLLAPTVYEKETHNCTMKSLVRRLNHLNVDGKIVSTL
jgi:hypothetical protein